MRRIFVKLFQFIAYKLIFSFFKLFPLKNDKIIYISHYGNRFGCNPKIIFEYISEHYPNYKHVIVLNDKTKHEVRLNTIYVVYYSFSFLYELATSKYWVVNTNLHPYLAPRKESVYFQTWHGAGAFKKFGLDLPSHKEKEMIAWKEDTSHWSKMICSSESVVDIYAQACGIDKDVIHPVGVPRNDIFFQRENSNKKKKFYQEYNLNKNKKIILYAPTYRDSSNDNPINLDFKKLKNELGEQYVFILKLHPLLSHYRFEDEGDEPFVLNLSAIDDIQELLLIADVLITDYSSVIFDFAITGKPIVFYAYDLVEYERGFYYDYQEFVPGPIVSTQNELVNLLTNYEPLFEKYNAKVISFAKEYNYMLDGKATERAVDVLLG